METQRKMTKQKKCEKEGFGKRSPLQHLNGLHFHKSSNLSSSSFDIASKLLLSSNSSSAPSLASSSSSSSSSSRSHLGRKATKVSSAVAQNVMTGSEENNVPRKPFAEKSKNKVQPYLGKRQYGKPIAKPTYQTAQRSKQCGQRNAVKFLKKGSGELAAKLKSSARNSSGEPPIKRFGLSIKSSLVSTERCTPGEKIGNKGFPDFWRFDDRKNARENSDSKTGSSTSVKTPPMEASVSPEIQCGSHSKLVALKSAATPICYGAGHLLSGVTDKRKCKRRGSLRGGCEKVNFFDDEESDRNVINNSPDSSVPLLAEASVRWLLSPCDEGREDQGSDSEIQLQQCKVNPGNAPSAFDLLSSPSTICGDVSDIELSNKKIEPLLAATPTTSNCTSISIGERKNVGANGIDNNSAISLGSLSSRNIIQTPSSDSSLYECVGGSNVVGQHRNCTEYELNSITEALNAASMSPRSEISIWDAPTLSFQCADMYSSFESIIPIQPQRNGHSVCSWMSDSTLENLALSQTRVSWRDGLVCKIDENDEFDCCPCLSDEEIDVVHCSDKQLMSYRASQPVGYKQKDLGIEYGGNEADAMKLDLDVSHSPMLLEDECIRARGNEKFSEDRINACAESICTNGGDLAASCDSDWT